MAPKNPLLLNDVCVAIIDCEHKTAPVQPDGYPSIRTPNIGRGRLILDGVNRVSDETYLQWTQRMEPHADDLILAREAPVGNVAIVPKNLKVCLGQRTVLIRPDQTKVVPGYLVYLLLGDELQGRIHSQSNGATVHHLNMKDIRGLVLPLLPSMDEQRRIASILSAYDDLIENNTRRIAILEEMARRLYEEWFVRFRFPGHEGLPMVESELGLVPEGWSIGPLGSITKLLSGYAFKSTAFCSDGQYGLVTIKNVHDGKFVEECTSQVAELPANMPAHCKLKVADILLSLTGNVGRCCLVTIDGCLLNQRVAKIQPVNSSDWAYSYLLFRSGALQERLDAIATGVAQQNLSPVESQKLPVITPPQELRKRFSESVSDLLLLALTLNRKNANLRTTRDLLLPKLISGELDVSTLPEPQAEII